MKIQEQDITKLLSPISLAHQTSELYDQFMQPFRYADQQYAIPITFSPVIMAYNKTMFKANQLEVPNTSWTWQELLQTAQQLTRRDSANNVKHYGFCFSSSMNRWPLFVMQNGGRFKQNEEVLPYDQATFAAIEFGLDLMYKYKVSPVYSLSNSELGEDLFAMGKVGMIMTTYYFLKQFEHIDFDWDITSFPSGKEPAAFALTTAVGMTANCKSKESAKIFLEYLYTEEVQTYIKEHGSSIPTLRKVAEQEAYPHVQFKGEGYYCFKEVLPFISTVKDMGLSTHQLHEVQNALSLVWGNLETLEATWSKLKQSI